MSRQVTVKQYRWAEDGMELHGAFELSLLDLFQQMGGRFSKLGLPMLHARVFRTPNGTPYLREPATVLVGRPFVDLSGVQEFLDGFDPALEFGEYLNDPDTLDDTTQLIKFAGQLCYMSFGPKRTWNRDARDYSNNLIESRHGSVFEHAVLNYLWYGISRSATHELVRHRHQAYSQLSQRYVDGTRLRFVERPEYVGDPVLHSDFESTIELIAAKYEQRTQRLLELQKQGNPFLYADRGTDRRKRVQQASRSVLSNEAEAPIVVSANIRAFRHVAEMRASDHAEIEIRRAAFKAWLCAAVYLNEEFCDYTIEEYPDGTYGVNTDNTKV